MPTPRPTINAPPTTVVDTEMLLRLLQTGATEDELADYLRVTVEAIRAASESDDARHARAVSMIRLRQTQMRVAHEGSVQLLVFLGKHYLGQADDRPPNPKVVILRRTVNRTPIPLLQGELLDDKDDDAPTRCTE